MLSLTVRHVCHLIVQQTTVVAVVVYEQRHSIIVSCPTVRGAPTLRKTIGWSHVFSRNNVSVDRGVGRGKNYSMAFTGQCHITECLEKNKRVNRQIQNGGIPYTGSGP